MTIRRAVAALFAAALLVPGVALADNCYNASRPGKDLSTNPADFSAPLFKGRWVWLPSVGVDLPAWGFEVPENYLNGSCPRLAARQHALLRGRTGSSSTTGRARPRTESRAAAVSSTEKDKAPSAPPDVAPGRMDVRPGATLSCVPAPSARDGRDSE